MHGLSTVPQKQSHAHGSPPVLWDESSGLEVKLKIIIVPELLGSVGLVLADFGHLAVGSGGDFFVVCFAEGCRSSYKKSWAGPLIQPQSSTRAMPCAMLCRRLGERGIL